MHTSLDGFSPFLFSDAVFNFRNHLLRSNGHVIIDYQVKLIQQTILHFQQGNSDKIYEIDLCEITQNEYVVNFQYGRRGASLREGTKTVFPVPLDEAQKVFEDLAQSKIKKGYKVGQSLDETDTLANNETASANPDEFETALLAHLEAVLDNPDTVSWSRSRILWRIGEARIRKAENFLFRFTFEGHTFNDYALVWAWGRCGSENAVPVLQQLPGNASDSLRRLQRNAILTLGSREQKATVAENILKELPNSVQTFVRESKPTELLSTLREFLFELKVLDKDFLTPLYELVPMYPHVRPVLLELLSELPFKPGYFRSIRYIFKLAEFHDDAELLGLLSFRMDREKPFYSSSPWSYSWVEGEYLDVYEEVKAENPRIAWSSKTRYYFLRRIIRSLERVARLNPDYYIKLATEICLNFQESDKTEPYQRIDYHWDFETQTSANIIHHYPSFSSFAVLGYLLYRNSPRYMMTSHNMTWKYKEGHHPEHPLPQIREEAFPKLWDQSPSSLVKILTQSRHQPVLEFASKAFEANPEKGTYITRELVVALLNKSFSNCQALGIELAKSLFNPDQPDTDLLLQILECQVEEARALATSWLITAQARLLEDKDFLFESLFNKSEILRTWYSQNVQSDQLNPELAQEIVTNTLAKVAGYTDWESKPLVLNPDFIQIFHLPLQTIPLDLITPLLSHPVDGVKGIGAKVLLIHPTPAEQLSPGLFAALIDSETPALRSIGVQLFGKLAPEILEKNKDILTNFCISRHAEIRQQAPPVIEKLLNRQPRFSQVLIELFLPMLWRKETFEGVHLDLATLILNQLSNQFPTINDEITWKLIRAPYDPANRIGAQLFHQNIRATQLSFKELVELGDHAILSLRETTWEFYTRNVYRCKREKEDAVRLLNVTWEDSRKFAMDFFSNQFDSADWDPETLVNICDSTQEEIQLYGQKLITRFFKEEDGVEYMLKLAQHPNTDLQQFVANYLDRFATGSTERIQKMEYYFLSVLSQVNKGRTAKERVFRFLERESMQNPEIAKIATTWLARTVLTVAVNDRARCIEILTQLQEKYPELGSPLTIKEIETK